MYRMHKQAQLIERKLVGGWAVGGCMDGQLGMWLREGNREPCSVGALCAWHGAGCARATAAAAPPTAQLDCGIPYVIVGRDSFWTRKEIQVRLRCGRACCCAAACP